MVGEKRYEIDPDKKFQTAFKKAAEKIGDLTIPLTLITKMWYKGNKSIFQLKGPGKYEDYKPNSKYKERKIRLIGQAYPMMLLSGQLEAAITEPTGHGAFNQIVNKTSLFLGVEKDVLPYAGVHQYGYKTTPKRPFLLTGVEQVATDGQKKAVGIYLKILADYVKQVTDDA